MPMSLGGPEHSGGSEFGMIESYRNGHFSRRKILTVGSRCAVAAMFPLVPASADTDNESDLIAQLTGTTPTQSDRIHLKMPGAFPNGYTVPMAFSVDSPMTEADHVKSVRILAPKNPLIDVATFYFTPSRSVPRASMRIRLAQPQFVVAVAELNDGSLLMTKTWVDVASDGCK